MQYSLDISCLGCSQRWDRSLPGFEHTYETDATGYKHVQAEAFGCHDKRRAGIQVKQDYRYGAEAQSTNSSQSCDCDAMAFAAPLQGCWPECGLPRGALALTLISVISFDLAHPRPGSEVRSNDGMFRPAQNVKLISLQYSLQAQ